ncbi:MAG: fructose bisphosphate aldolase [Bacilli bacterium]|nr:fructose bisphosphate aldolase [Bacilli bacterium]
MNDYLNQEKLNIVKNRAGFIAALDQSGGSTANTLKNYGISDSAYSTEEEMFSLIHEMRMRVFTSPVFTSEKILGSILFFKTMQSMVNGKYTADYLWDEKKIVSFLKIDKGLAEEEHHVKLMKPILDFDGQMRVARERGIFGTKMRSVILGADPEGIRDVVRQQFALAKTICEYGLVPIIEPEVDILISDKEKAENILKEEIIRVLDNWNPNHLIMFKFSIPTNADLYEDLYRYPCVVRVVALSGGYDTEHACQLLKQNHKMIASFSRALLQNLYANQTEEEFNAALKKAIDEIYDASINKD